MKHKELRKLIKEMLSEDNILNIEPELIFKIYNLIAQKLPEFKLEFPTKSAFYTYINDNV